MSKYGNTKITFNGNKFDSAMEADYYRYLDIQKSKGEIKDFEIHPKFILQPSFKYKGKTIQSITYTSDFKVYCNDGTIEIVDVKGHKTNEFKLKEKILKYMFKNNENISIFCVTLHKEQWVRI